MIHLDARFPSLSLRALVALFPAAVLSLWHGSSLRAGEERELRAFRRVQLHDQFWSEGATYGDFNRDGKQDVVAGPWWWEGPDFKVRHEIYPATETFELKLGPLTSVKVPGFHGALGR